MCCGRQPSGDEQWPRDGPWVGGWPYEHEATDPLRREERGMYDDLAARGVSDQYLRAGDISQLR
jgi:hypothetical protein